MKRTAADLGWPALGAALALCLAALYPIDNPDTFGHLAAGREIWQRGEVPKLDSFSYFRPEPAAWVNYEWLSDWLFYASWRAGGYPGLSALKLLLIAALAAGLVAIGRARAGPLGAAASALVLLSDLPGLRFRLSVRPQLFGLLFGALYVGVLSELIARAEQRGADAARKNLHWAGVLAAVHVAWVNLHGSHLLGFALSAIALACALRTPGARGPLALLLGAQLAASCVSPYGPAIVSDALAHTLDPAYRALIEEWQAWRPSQSIAYPAVVAWQLLGLAVAWPHLPRGALRRFQFGSALLLLLMAMRSLRFIPDFLALTAPTLGAGLAPLAAAVSETRRRRVLVPAALLLAAAAFAIALQLPPGHAFGWGESLRDRPAASAAWLSANLPESRILAVMPDAWDLMFALPRAKFLIDGRTPFYGPAHVQRVQRAWSSAPEMRALLDSSATDVVVAQPLVAEQQPALRALLAYPDFQLVMIEQKHCVFARALPSRAALLRERALSRLQPGYAVEWLYAERADPDAIRAELAKLGDHPNVRPYRDWVLGLLSARSLARAEGRAGLRAPRSQRERAQLADALEKLRAADRALEIVPSVTAQHALAAIADCQLDEAERLIARARQDDEARELLFGAQELALRRGELQTVQAFIEQASRVPAAHGDPWIEALEEALRTPVACQSEL